ncbi:MAG: phage holin family protein [Candidatus Methylopumilus sp.]
MITFLAQWVATTIALWASAYMFNGIKFESLGALIVSALLLGFANSLIKPLLIVLTLPITFFTFGIFLLVINGAVLLLVSYLVKGFIVSSLGTAILASIAVSLISFLIRIALVGDVVVTSTSSKGPWI